MRLQEECVVNVFSSLNSRKEEALREEVLVLSPYQKSYSKALGKDGILVCHEETVMHRNAAEKADLFKQNLPNPDQI